MAPCRSLPRGCPSVVQGKSDVFGSSGFARFGLAQHKVVLPKARRPSINSPQTRSRQTGLALARNLFRDNLDRQHGCTAARDRLHEPLLTAFPELSNKYDFLDAARPCRSRPAMADSVDDATSQKRSHDAFQDDASGMQTMRRSDTKGYECV